jgi:CHAT domain-containing protein
MLDKRILTFLTSCLLVASPCGSAALKVQTTLDCSPAPTGQNTAPAGTDADAIYCVSTWATASLRMPAAPMATTAPPEASSPSFLHPPLPPWEKLAQGVRADTGTPDRKAADATPGMVGDTLHRGMLNKATAYIQELKGREFSQYIGENVAQTSITPESIQKTLNDLARQTGKKPAVIYAFALPDALELLLFTPEAEPQSLSVPAANKATLLAAVKEFRNQITNPLLRNSNSYLAPAKQLYEWLVAPYEAQLQAQGTDTLLFAMDVGLRSLPVAALHDGQKFLIEKYALGMIPCFSLTDTDYVSLKNAPVLAMGASQFSQLAPLPAVPVEIQTIAGKLWRGKAFLNQDFTLDNLNAQRQNTPYPIVHLATHAEFLPGRPANSYIQLWDSKLRLDQLKQLRLSDPKVELLVLSACRTALGDEKAELGFAGLAIYSGVKSALASLWYVSDEGTLGLMTEFYRQLKGANIKAEALRQAQLAMLRGQVRLENGILTGSKGGVTLPPELARLGNQTLSHPYYWASFVMIGSPW